MADGRSSASSRRATRNARRSALALACLLITAAAPPDARGDEMAASADPAIARAWRVLRQVDCARCHGRSYEGLAAPSIVDYAATRTPEQFTRMIVDGDPSRGMPGYRSNAYVVDHLDDIRRYFVARANGTIGPGYRAPPASGDR
jgi:hypothetical protein